MDDKIPIKDRELKIPASNTRPGSPREGEGGFGAGNADLSGLRIDRSKPGGRSNSGRTARWFFRLSIVLAVAVMAFVAGREWDSLFSSAIEVQLTTVTLQSPFQSEALLSASGYVVAQRQAAVASKGTGRLVYLGVVEGDRVKKDQIIARLEDNDIRAQLAEAEATLRLNEAQLGEARNNFSRQNELLKAGATAQSDFEAAESQYKKVLASIDLAKAQVEAARVALENTIIRAPFEGTVLTKNADVGEIVAPLAAGANSRATVVTIADLSSLQVEADVSESNIQRIEPAQPCEIMLDAYPDTRYQGAVSKIVPTADRAKATVLTKIKFIKRDDRVLPEMSTKVTFLSKAIDTSESASTNKITITPAAVTTREHKKVVFVIRDDRAIETPVELGGAVGNMLEVVSGVSAGDRVVLNPPQKMAGTMKVKLKEK